jgi:hypothetical protein
MAGLDNAFNTTFLACFDYRRISLKSISFGILFKNQMRDFPERQLNFPRSEPFGKQGRQD